MLRSAERLAWEENYDCGRIGGHKPEMDSISILVDTTDYKLYRCKQKMQTMTFHGTCMQGPTRGKRTKKVTTRQ